MFNVSDYFKKFVGIERDVFRLRDIISKSIQEVCGIEGGSFEVKKGILYIKASPVMRSIVYTKKEALIKAIREKDPNIQIHDVR